MVSKWNKRASDTPVKHGKQWRHKRTLGVVWPWVTLQMSAVLCARGQHSPFLFLLPPQILPSSLPASSLPPPDSHWRPPMKTTLEATMRLGMSLFLWYPPALRLMSLYFWSHFPTSGISRHPSSALQLGISFSFIMIKLHSAWVHDKQLYCISYIHASKEKASWAPNVCRC